MIGFGLFVSGLGILKIEKITIAQKRATWIIGLIMMLLAVVLSIRYFMGEMAAGDDSSSTYKPEETYIAKISTRDHNASSGKYLTDGYDIIQQDRYYFHNASASKDPQDQNDSFFGVYVHRLQMKDMLMRGMMSMEVKKIIETGCPLIQVHREKKTLTVSILSTTDDQCHLPTMEKD